MIGSQDPIRNQGLSEPGIFGYATAHFQEEAS